MKLTVLGKYGPYPKAGGGTSSYLLSSENTTLALDFGSGACARYKRFSDKLDAAVLSHLHFDHMSDILPLVYELQLRGGKLKVFMPKTPTEINSLIRAQSVFDVTEIADGFTANVGCFKLSFAKLDHSVESYGVRVTDGTSTFFYSGDTSFTERVIMAASGCSTALLDAAQPSTAPDTVPHMNLTHAREISDKTGARVLVTHINPDFDPAAEAKRLDLETVEEMTTYEI